MTTESAIGMVRRGEAECIVMRKSQNGSLEFLTAGHGRGIAPFLDIFDTYDRSQKLDFEKLSVEEKMKTGMPKAPLSGCVVVDKIIGRAAAFVAISCGVDYVHGEIMCEGAKQLLEQHGIKATCTLLVPQIRDRSFGHLCPLEDSVADISDVDTAMKAMRTRIAALRAKEEIVTPALPKPSRTLVAYYSWGGHTRSVAETIAHATNADIFEICPSVPYPKNYKECLAKSKEEIAANVRPSLMPTPVDFSGYDTVFIGSPVWFGKIAPPVSTFLSVADLKGKKLIPFFTHGGGGATTAHEDFRAKTGSTIAEPGIWKDSDIHNSAQSIKTWVKSQQDKSK